MLTDQQNNAIISLSTNLDNIKITTDEPNAHAELILKVDGLPEETLDILRKKFNALAEMVEREVREKASLTA